MNLLPWRIADQPPDDYEFRSRIDKRLYRRVNTHRLRRRAAPRTLPATCDTLSIRATRSAGVSRNWLISSVKSIPYFFAASMRLPGAGFRNLSSARASSSGVNARSSFTTKSYRGTLSQVL